MNRNAFVLVLTGAAITANASLLTFKSNLNGAQEVPTASAPAVSTPAVGYGELNIDTMTLGYSGFIRWRNLVGTPTDAHIHLGSPTQNGPVIYGFGVSGTTTESINGVEWTRKEFSGTLVNKTIAANGPTPWNGATWTPQQQIDLWFKPGFNTYFNLHTTARPAGEIRGAIVPEPGTMMALGAGALALLRRRKAR